MTARLLLAINVDAARWFVLPTELSVVAVLQFLVLHEEVAINFALSLVAVAILTMLVLWNVVITVLVCFTVVRRVPIGPTFRESCSTCCTSFSARSSKAAGLHAIQSCFKWAILNKTATLCQSRPIPVMFAIRSELTADFTFEGTELFIEDDDPKISIFLSTQFLSIMVAYPSPTGSN